MRDGQFPQPMQAVDTCKKDTEECHNGIDEEKDVKDPIIPNSFLKDGLSKFPNAETNFFKHLN